MPKSSQETVVYMRGDQGPFRCDHCEYFSAPNRCRIVEGDIDPAGCCNLYEKDDDKRGTLSDFDRKRLEGWRKKPFGEEE